MATCREVLKELLTCLMCEHDIDCDLDGRIIHFSYELDSCYPDVTIAILGETPDGENLSEICNAYIIILDDFFESKPRYSTQILSPYEILNENNASMLLGALYKKDDEVTYRYTGVLVDIDVEDVIGIIMKTLNRLFKSLDITCPLLEEYM